MAAMDLVLGIIGLFISLFGLFYLFVRLIIVPLFPISKENIINLPEEKPVEILLGLAISGLSFLGSLGAITIYKLNKNYYKTLKNDRQEVKH